MQSDGPDPSAPRVGSTTSSPNVWSAVATQMSTRRPSSPRPGVHLSVASDAKLLAALPICVCSNVGGGSLQSAGHPAADSAPSQCPLPQHGPTSPPRHAVTPSPPASVGWERRESIIAYRGAVALSAIENGHPTVAATTCPSLGHAAPSSSESPRAGQGSEPSQETTAASTVIFQQRRSEETSAPTPSMIARKQTVYVCPRWDACGVYTKRRVYPNPESTSANVTVSDRVRDAPLGAPGSDGIVITTFPTISDAARRVSSSVCPTARKNCEPERGVITSSKKGLSETWSLKHTLHVVPPGCVPNVRRHKATSTKEDTTSTIWKHTLKGDVSSLVHGVPPGHVAVSPSPSHGIVKLMSKGLHMYFPIPRKSHTSCPVTSFAAPDANPRLAHSEYDASSGQPYRSVEAFGTRSHVPKPSGNVKLIPSFWKTSESVARTV
mmetsp:Transcript_55896/g.132629  ORF Transcript_55896/g.132629 Transcript_55896/m.132629 type:complete len:437 (+) Transcript_55896:164-1474(+)